MLIRLAILTSSHSLMAVSTIQGYGYPFGGVYKLHQERLRQQLRPTLKARVVEDLSQRSFKSLPLQYGSSNNDGGHRSGLANLFALFYGNIYIQQAQPTPDESFYMPLAQSWKTI